MAGTPGTIARPSPKQATEVSVRAVNLVVATPQCKETEDPDARRCQVIRARGLALQQV